MPFDPAQPADNSPLSSQVMREQLTSLKALIDAVLTITAAQVDGVSTLDPGDPANAAVSVNGNTLHFTFGIPRGNDGSQGPPGTNGSDGGPGPQGAQGPPFANAIVDGVNTLPAGSNASVNVSFDGTNVHFTFSIPQGSDGATGPQGPPGEVTQTDLNNGLLNNLSQCSNNSNSVGNLSQGADGSYNQSQMQQVLDKLDELINALRR
ncbi:MAG: hypothetical protein U1F81_14140 [Verrucomicrobiaceae bacterium]